jgi:hypothetical protein
MGVRLTVMGWRHASKAIYCRYINNKAAVKAFVEGDEDEDEGEDEAFNIQTKHGFKVGGGVYGRPIMKSPFSTEAKRVALRRISKKWHRWLLFKSALEELPKRGTQATKTQKEAVEKKFW